MSGEISVRSGWNNSQLAGMSPPMQRRVEAADREYEAEARRVERERAERAEALQARAVQQAIARGH
jgi:hypothetical protein